MLARAPSALSSVLPGLCSVGVPRPLAAGVTCDSGVWPCSGDGSGDDVGDELRWRSVRNEARFGVSSRTTEQSVEAWAGPQVSSDSDRRQPNTWRRREEGDTHRSKEHARVHGKTRETGG